ncbi:MAG: hybrid sensor histidine kinase/response regulator [Bdellovibrionaceae bacterium]|nr:hybrid sensor histidine kinase/response regulator [Bdellovibrionales bacterium]MCB9086536.1 hybrid sensor histidine kinase/response regulator [Pseudobdellovibrionaceae bacterium]
MKHSILCVDDEIDNVDALERIFRRHFRVLKATSGAEGLALLKEATDVAVIISDQRMPKMTGVEFLKKTIKTHPDAIRILLTGYTDIESVIDAINSGEVYRYLTKPWDSVDLANTINKAIEKFDLRRELVEKNKALEAALEELKSLDQAKTQFMVLINHELKTPLTVLLSFLELLQEGTLDDEQQVYVNRIDQSAKRLKTIIDEVLELVSAETGQIKISSSKIDIQEMITDIHESWKLRLEGKSLGWSESIEVDKIKTDRTLLVNILNRLIDNAVKFGTKGSDVEIQVTCDSEADFCLFKVRNKGKAMTKNTIARVLKPFTLDEDLLHHSKGLGMGLSLSQALLKVLGSEIDITCPKGYIEVSFRLPSG